jgi:DNA-binding NarL/FixJ family response regulator
LSAHIPQRITHDVVAIARDGARVPATRVLLADHAGRSRNAVAALVAGLDHVALVGEVGDRSDIAAALRRDEPDVLMIDDRLLRDGAHVLSGLGPHRPGLRVIVLGVDDDPAFAERARRLGAEAWVAKDRAGDELPGLLAR